MRGCPRAALWLGALSILVLCSTARDLRASIPPADMSAREVVQEVVAEVEAVLRDPSLTDLQRRQGIENFVRQYADTETLVRLVLARHWKKFSETERADFACQFQANLILTYWKNASHLLFERIEISDDREEASGDWTVVTKVITPAGGFTRIDYRLRRKPGEGSGPGDWKIIDVLVEGVSLVSNFRAQFQEFLTGRGATPQKLIDALRKKNAEASKSPEDG